jgi:small-conductance mechanosensitive channel
VRIWQFFEEFAAMNWSLFLEKTTWVLVPVAVFVLTLAIGYIVRKILFWRLAAWSKTTETQIDDIIIESIKTPLVIWFFMLGLYLALQTLGLPTDLATEANNAKLDKFVAFANRLLVILGILSITFALANMVGKIVQVYASHLETALPVTSLTRHVSRIIILALGILIILHELKINIAPILATLGVGGLAVALALQDTLANVFAGFHIIAAKQIKIGDFVKLESGEEGFITDISWRTTKVKLSLNNVVLVPNETLAKSIVLNYNLPDKEMDVVVQLGVHYDSDLRKVVQVTADVARQVLREVPGGVTTYEPLVRFHTFGDSSVDFSATLRVKEVLNQGLIKHEFIMRIHERYAKEGIVMPYPVCAINTSQEKAAAV